MRALCLLLTLAGPLLAQAKVSGRVVNSQTGEPIRKASLVLRKQQATLTAATGADGAFTFTGVTAGTYTLSADRTGFLRKDIGRIEVTESQAGLSGIDVRMMPLGAIGGKVIDEDGDPVERATALVLIHRNGQLRVAQSAMTNDLGDFRLAPLAPGKYTLVVRKDGMLPREGAELGYAPVEYPSPVPVAAGDQVAGITVTLRLSPVYSIRGRVEGLANAEGRMSVSVTNLNAAIVTSGGGPGGMGGPGRGGMGGGFGAGGMGGPGLRAAGGMVRSDGTFEIRNLHPGSYSLALNGFRGGPVSMGRTQVEVGRAPVDGVVLTARGPVELSGTVKFDGETTAERKGLRLSAYSDAPFASRAAGEVKEDGTFTVARVAHEQVRFQLNPPAGTYLKRISSGGQDITATGLDLTQAETAGPVEITLGTKPATIAGTAEGGEVVLVLGSQRSVKVNTSGQFSLTGLAPGEYRLVVLENTEALNDFDPADVSRFETVKIGEGETKTVQLKRE